MLSVKVRSRCYGEGVLSDTKGKYIVMHLRGTRYILIITLAITLHSFSSSLPEDT